MMKGQLHIGQVFAAGTAPESMGLIAADQPPVGAAPATGTGQPRRRRTLAFALPFFLRDLSRLIHDLLFDDASMSLCARAYDRQEISLFWWLWLRVFTEAHCRRSWLWHCEQHWPER